MLKPCITEEKGGRDNVKEIRRDGEREGYVKKNLTKNLSSTTHSSFLFMLGFSFDM